MNCCNHPDTVAVASCSNACGRGLCEVCAAQYEPPSCSVCIVQQADAVARDTQESRKDIIKKIVINGLFLLAYIIPMSYGTEEPGSPMWLMTFWFIWGFIGFRWVMDAFYSFTGLALFASLRTWGFIYVIGSLIIAMLGLVIIPILIITEMIQLLRLPKVSSSES